MVDRSAHLAARALRVSRYLSVATLCAGLHNVIMIGLDFAGIHYAVSLLISLAILTPTSFVLQSTFTFAVERTWPAFWRFAGVMLVNAPMSFVFLWGLYDLLALPMVIAAPVSTVALLAWNYLASGWAVRARPSAKESAA